MIGQLALSTHWGPNDLDALTDADIDFWVGVLNEGSEAMDARAKSR